MLIRTLFAATLAIFFGHLGAEPPEPPSNPKKFHTFNGKEIEVSDAELTDDISLLRLLFGTGSRLDSSHIQQVQAEGKNWLGIAIKLPANPARDPISGTPFHAIEVTQVFPGYGGSLAGLEVEDLIVSIDDKPLEGADKDMLTAFSALISSKRSHEKLKMRILRRGSYLELEVTIQPYPRSKALLKLQPSMAKNAPKQAKSLLVSALEKEQLLDVFQSIVKEFQNETDKAVSPLIYSGGYNPFRLQEVNHVMYHPLELPIVARKITDRLHGAFNKTHYGLHELTRVAMDELDMKFISPKAEAEKPPADMTEYLERLVKAIEFANSERAAVLSVLDVSEIDFLYETAPQFLVGNWGLGGGEMSESAKTKEGARLLKFFTLVLKLDLPRLLSATGELARAIDLNLPKKLDKSAGKLAHYPSNWTLREADNLIILDTPVGRILIGGTRDNVYTDDAVLIIDFDGNDKYFNRAGGSTRQHPFSIAIDLSGNDTYSSAVDFSQGAGLLGGGFLIDLEGDDWYKAKNYSQGTGLLGIGMLADLGGNDHYTATSVSQGAAAFGAGILAEGGGNDTYSGSFFVQGAGYIQGFGAIIEMGGNDKYLSGGLYEDFRDQRKSYLSLSQGFGYGMRPNVSLIGTSGGIGILTDAEGNDLYEADYFAQGSSYWFSIGILDDRKGDDRYISGRYSQGAGIHMSAGVLMDGEGNDIYLASFGVAQGCGHDYGVGFLVDGNGNDRYVSTTLAQGAGIANGIGILSDNGGNDEYFLNSAGQGYGGFETTRGMVSFGLLFDISGTNFYSLGGASNGITYKPSWGIQVDRGLSR